MSCMVGTENIHALRNQASGAHFWNSCNVIYQEQHDSMVRRLSSLSMYINNPAMDQQEDLEINQMGNGTSSHPNLHYPMKNSKKATNIHNFGFISPDFGKQRKGRGQKIVDYNIRQDGEGAIMVLRDHTENLPNLRPNHSGTRSSGKEIKSGLSVDVWDSDSSSSSFSTSDSMDDGERCCMESSADVEADSAAHVPSGLKRIGSFSSKKGLSTHFSGKSKSFTSFADISSLQGIQDLAKPESPYGRRRAFKFLEGYKCFPLHSVEKSIVKRSSTSGRNGSSLAVAVAMSSMDGKQFMDTLLED